MAKKTTLNLKPGRYFAGITRPWYAGQGAVRREIERRLGLSDIQFFGRKTAALPINPRVDPRYDDAWEEWIAARYTGPVRQVETDRLWSWVVRVPEDKAPPLPALPPAASARSGAGGEPSTAGPGALVVLGGLGAALLAVTYAARR